MLNLKSLCCACTVALALIVALGAGSASASQFRAEAYPVTLKGAQNETSKELTFNLPGSHGGDRLTCWPDGLSGSETLASSTLSVTPNFGSECEMGAGYPTVKANGCHYELHSANESAPYTGTMDIVCEKPGEAIEVVQKAGNCTVAIPGQSGLSSVGYANSGKGRARALMVTFNVSKLRYALSGTSCLFKDSGTYENGTITGEVAITGRNQAGAYGLGVYLGNEQIAEPPLFKSESGAERLTGEANEAFFGFGTLGFECSGSTLRGYPPGPAGITELTTSPEFSGCELAGMALSFRTNECRLVARLAEGSAPGVANMALSCPGGPLSAVWNGGACEMRIPSQEWAGSTSYENAGTGQKRTVLLRSAVTNMKYERSGDCLGAPTGTFTDGGLTAAWTVKASTAALAQKGIWVE